MRVFVYVIIFFLPFLCLGQAPSFYHFPAPNELKNVSINKIFEDSRGFIWLGTYDGVKKFDGYTVTSYLDFSDSLGPRDIRCFYENEEGMLFIGSFHSGLFIYNPYKNSFEHFVNKLNNPASISSNTIVSIFKFRGGTCIVTDIGFDLYDDKEKTFEHLSFSKQVNDQFTSVTKDLQNNYWLTGTKGLYRYNDKTSQVELIQKYSEVSNVTYAKIYCDHLFNIWAANRKTGLVRYNVLSHQYIEYRNTSNPISDKVITDFLEDKEHNIWISTNGDGLFQYDHSKNTFRQYQHHGSNNRSLKGNSIHTLFEDSNGVIWIGYYKQGIDLINKVSIKFSLIDADNSNDSYLTNESVLSFAETSERIYIGTDGGGLNVLNKRSGQIKPVIIYNGKPIPSVIKSLAVEDSSTIWYGSYNNGIGKLVLANGNYKLEEVLLEGESAWSLLYTKDKLWVGTLNEGLKIIDLKTGKITHHSFKEFCYNSPVAIQKLFRDSNNNIWVGTSTAGFFCFLKGEELVQLDTEFDVKLNVRDLFEDFSGNIWLATSYKGVGKILDVKTKKIAFYPNLIENEKVSCSSVIVDNSNNLWIGTNKGLVKFTPTNGKSITFQELDGLQGQSFNDAAKLKSQTGLLYFGGPNGMNFFNPLTLSMNAYAPKVSITDFKVFNKSLANQPNRIQSNINVTKEIEINQSENSFTIEFTALNYILPQKNKFAYKLLPFDKDWIYVDASKRFASYTNLTPGSYYFRVMASNNDGKWNPVAKELKIIITPSWWQTWWFKFLISVFVVGLAIAVFYLRLNAIRKQNKLLNEEVKRKTASLLHKNDILEEYNLELIRQSKRNSIQKQEITVQKEKLEELNKTKDKLFSIIAHDLKNPINALSILISLLKNNYKHEESEVLIINDIESSTENVKFLILNLLEWAKSQSEKIKVNYAYTSLESLVDENLRLFGIQLQLKHIEVEKSIPWEHAVYGDKEMINTILRNIISNCCKYLPSNNKIIITSQLNNDKLSIIIEDNGSGFPNDLLEKFDQFTYTESLTSGLGLTLCKEFTKLNCGTITLENNQQTSGARVILSFEGKIQGIKEEQVHNDTVVETSEIAIVNTDFIGKKILLVEDDASLRNSIKLLLSKNKFIVFEDEDVEKSLLIAKNEDVDLVVSDIMLQGNNGINLCRKIKSNNETSHIPVLLMTAENSDEVHQNGLIAGADAYIKKPFNQNIFLGSINNLFASQEKLKRLFHSEPMFETTRVTNSESDQKLLLNSVAFIEKNISNHELNGDVLSHELGLSKSVLYVKIKKLTGKTVNEFIRTIRLKNSIPLIISENYSISEIAAMMGFNSPSYFSKSFTSQYGVPPKEYLSKYVIKTLS